ncbi:hypothetical protein LOC67_09320 [Stieleria sp. JC731]|uniref:hypothetical protein n=1 Tax=Pirellulaceae TaxID=2691357 RepID=UPI001E567BE5|nr:hypothetical protein [Stieleria sp. JC731]MCC9600763.1 hypothetical protein [Stieleria sp. JC731]
MERHGLTPAPVYCSSSYDRILEANYLVQREGWEIDDACKLIEISPAEFYVTCGVKLPYTPSPAMVADAIAEIQSGKVNAKGNLRRQRQADREFREWNEDADPYDLAGDIDEDACPMPEWFRG